MIEFRGTYFDGKMSMGHSVAVRVTEGVLSVYDIENRKIVELPVHWTTFDPPLGRTHRTITFPGGGKILTYNFDAFDRLQHTLGKNSWTFLLCRLESHWTSVLIGLTVLIVCVFFFTFCGIPWGAKIAASFIPFQLKESISTQTLNLLDKQFLSPSTLEREKAECIQRCFTAVIEDMALSGAYRLELRKGNRLSANAFALPSGIIVFTDELAGLVESDEEAAGIFAHEICHVEHHHGVRSVIQNTGIFLLLAILAGDVASITSVSASLPTIFIEAGYSRRFENEADEAAARYLLRKGYGIGPYRDILMRIREQSPHKARISWLSSHPALADRLSRIDAIGNDPDVQ